MAVLHENYIFQLKDNIHYEVCFKRLGMLHGFLCISRLHLKCVNEIKGDLKN